MSGKQEKIKHQKYGYNYKLSIILPKSSKVIELIDEY